jgi:hypothetical protein
VKANKLYAGKTYNFGERKIKEKVKHAGTQQKLDKSALFFSTYL